jgi:hypothetical protein
LRPLLRAGRCDLTGIAREGLRLANRNLRAGTSEPGRKQSRSAEREQSEQRWNEHGAK